MKVCAPWLPSLLTKVVQVVVFNCHKSVLRGQHSRPYQEALPSATAAAAARMQVGGGHVVATKA